MAVVVSEGGRGCAGGSRQQPAQRRGTAACRRHLWRAVLAGERCLWVHPQGSQERQLAAVHFHLISQQLTG